MDARVALFETAFVALALFRGRQIGEVASDDPGKGFRVCQGDLHSCTMGVSHQRVGEFGRCRFGTSFPPRSASILFFFGSPRTNKSSTGRRRESRNSCVEIVWIDPNVVVAQTTRE